MLSSTQIDVKKWYRSTHVKTFYLINRERIFTAYREINSGDKTLSPGNWNRFVNSLELHNIIFPSIKMMSAFGLEILAYGEPTENLGMELHTDEGVVYFAIPMLPHDDMKCPHNIMSGIQQAATRTLTTIVCHMFFRDIYVKPFMILKDHDGWVTMNEDYEYVLAK